MRRGTLAALLAVIIVASAGTGYLVGSTRAPVTTTFTQTTVGLLSECSSGTSCTAENPYGLRLFLSIDTPLVPSNGSFDITVSEFNPTTHFVNLSRSNQWYLDNLPTLWTCYGGSPPWGIAIFRGYYTLQNVSSAKDLLYANPFVSCLTDPRGSVTGFSIPPLSTLIRTIFNGKTLAPVYPYIPFYPYGPLPIQIYATDGTDLNSLGSSQPAVYTIAVGDEWGAFVLLHFSVVRA